MQGCIVGEDCLKLIAQTVAVSPHNMFVESAISAYDLIKSDDRSSFKRETDIRKKKFNMNVIKKQEYYHGFFEESELDSDR